MAKSERRKSVRRVSKRSPRRRDAEATPVAAAAGFSAQTQPVDLKDSTVEDALRSGEHSGLLEDYFGPAAFAEIRRLAQDAAQRGRRGGPRVLILPGLMGSKLGYPSTFLFDDVIWADPVDIALGRLGELELDGKPSKISPLGVMLFAYLKLKFKLQIAGYDVDFHAYDWRKSILGLGKELADAIEKESGKVHLVAHSMGGLVARASLIAKPKKLDRVVMLGTPNFGSFSPIQAFRGNDSLANKIAFLDLSHSKEDLARIFGSFPGLCEMIPSPEKFTTDFFDPKSWPSGGVRPSDARLAEALKVQRLLPIDFRKLTIIAGVDQNTVVDARVENGEFVYSQSLKGDGTVPLDCVLLPTAKKTYYVVEQHGSLPNNATVADAVDAILATGETDLLPDSYQPRRAGPLAQVPERALDVVPYQGNPGRALSAAEKRRIIEEVAAPDQPAAMPGLTGRVETAGAPAESEMADTVVIGRRRQHRLEVTLAFGSISEVEADAYVLGMFPVVQLGGAAVMLDGMLGGAISQMMSRRMFGASVGEISILPTGRHPVRADVIAFAGLGAFDAFTPDTLEVVAENLVRTFIATRIDEFAMVPIGGSSGGFTMASLTKLMTGFVRGLKDADGDHRFRGLTICETDRDRFTALQKDFYALCATKLLDDVEVTLREIELPPPAPRVVRGAAATLAAPPTIFLMVREEPSPPRGMIEYSCSILTAGSKATVFKARQTVPKPKLDQHLAKLGRQKAFSLKEIEQFGTELTNLVLPDSVRKALSRHLDKPLVVVHDAGASRIPWETLEIEGTAPALKAGLSHRYEAEDLSIAKWLEERQRDPTLDVLLIVNPTEDLSGAEAEGARVEALLQKLGRGVKVHPLRGAKARKQAVMQHLSSGTYDVFHYAGHAFFDPLNPERSGIICAGHDVLSGAELAGLSTLPSLAFFNACESGRVRRGPQSVGITPDRAPEDKVQSGTGFAEAFLRGGIANYIGTYWPVGDAAALTFAETLYTKLLDGERLGAAVMAGRLAVKAVGSADWADYILYGDAEFELKRRSRGGS